MDLCKEIQVQNAAGHFVTPTGLKKRSGRKTKKVLRSWVDRFHRQKKNSRLSEASTPEMSSESYQPIQSQASSKCLSSNNSVPSFSESNFDHPQLFTQIYNIVGCPVKLESLLKY
nr:uncharacterized protein LOC113708707 isoform X2 [Coffea arabica]